MIPYFVCYRGLDDHRWCVVPWEQAHIIQTDPRWVTLPSSEGPHQFLSECLIVHVHDGHSREASVICLLPEVTVLDFDGVGQLLRNNVSKMVHAAPRPWPTPPEGAPVRKLGTTTMTPADPLAVRTDQAHALAQDGIILKVAKLSPHRK